MTMPSEADMAGMTYALFMFCRNCNAIIHADDSGHFLYCDSVVSIARSIQEEILPVTVPTEAGFDWSSITATAVERLRAPKVKPIPPHIVALAQASYEGVENPAGGEKLHVLRYQFDTEARASAFAKLMKRAGEHTTPATSVSVVIDPDFQPGSEENPSLVAWRAGVKRGPRAV
jgi:hypothetical protein